MRRLGERLRLARMRRRLSAKQVAERAGMTPMTLRSLERGGTGVTIGAYLAVMQVLGLETDFDLLAQADTTGRALQDAQVSKRDRARRSTASGRSQRMVSGGSGTMQLRPLSQIAANAQLPTVLGTLPAEQLREAVETSAQAMETVLRPIRDAQKRIQESGFASSNALAELIDTEPPSKRSER